MFRKVYEVASNSVDPRTKIGCVIRCSDGTIVSAHNDLPKKNWAIVDRIRDDKDFKRSVVEHAEVLAIRELERTMKAGLANSLWVNEIPCPACIRSIVGSPIETVHLHYWWLIHRKLHGPDPSQQLADFQDCMNWFGKKVVISKEEVNDILALRDDRDFYPSSKVTIDLDVL